MRITNTAMVRSHLYDTQQNLSRMNKINEQINSGKVINRVSDDPHKAIKIMNLNNEIKYTEKYNYNIDETVGWMNNTDAALENLNGLLGEIKDSILKVGNGTYSKEEIKAINTDMNEKIKEIADVLNTTHGGKYIFGGTNVEEPPMKAVQNTDGTVSIEFNKDKNGQTIANTGDLKANISDGINLDYNVSAGEILTGKDDKGNPIDFLGEINKVSKLMNDIINGNEQTSESAKKELLGSTKENIDKLFNHALDERTSLGARVKTAETVKELNDENILNMKSVLSLDQDTDHVEKFIELKSAELVYQASIQVGTKLIQPTILDYMR